MYLNVEINFMRAESSFILLFPLSDLVSVNIGDHAQKGKGKDRDDHEMPFMSIMQEDSQNEDPISDDERPDNFG